MPTSPTTITALPTPPQTSDGAALFATRADALVGALPTLVTQTNAAAANVYANAVETLNNANTSATNATTASTAAATATGALANVAAAPGTAASSTTSLTVGTGSKSLTVQTGKSLTASQAVVIESLTDPRAWMLGLITSYNSGTGALVVNVTATGGAGTFAAWDVRLLGALPVNARQGQSLTWDNGRPVWGEKVRRIGASTNIHRYSNEFDNVAWTKSGGTVTLTAGAVPGPFGALDGWKAETSTGSGHAYFGSGGGSAGEVYTASCFFKYGNKPKVGLEIYYPGTPGGTQTVHANLLTGATEIYSGNSGDRFVIDFGVVDCGDGWWRIYLTHVVPPGSTFVYTTIFFSDYYGGEKAPGDFCYLFGVQLQPGRLGVYAPTTSSTASGGGVLRPDLMAYSEQVDTSEGSTPWALLNCTRVGKVVSPIGTLRATCYSAHTVGNLVAQYTSFVVGVQYTIGAWFRQATLGSKAGTLLLSGHAGDAGLAATATDLDTTWRYFEHTFVASSTSGYMWQLYSATTGTPDICVWGFRLAKGPTARYTLPNVSTVTAGASEMATINTRHAVDSSASAISINVPDGMKSGDWFEIADDGAAAATNNITLLRGPYSAIDGAAEDFVIDVSRWSGRFTFDPSRGLVIS